MPPDIARLLTDAAGDPDELKVVAKVAKRSYPEAAAAIDAEVTALTEATAAKHKAEMASKNVLHGWSGRVEVGAFRSTGNTDNAGGTVNLDIRREGVRWIHGVRGNIDYQREDGVTSRERYNANYQGEFHFARRSYAVATLGYDSDRFAGIKDRFAQSVGLGHIFADDPALRITADLGPALRQTRFTDGRNTDAVGLRAGANLRWEMTTGLILSQDAALFIDDSHNTSLNAVTALTAKLTGRFSARLSLRVNTESDPPVGRETNDTITRATLLYDF